ncbi:DUF2637 domain-containing protein [Streptomyces sp. CT34]|uniref:DUF2637 domain-containing protein n=1 Tax=Streptomyces sp. CT34 TaxID=1553907 RepID=UPI0005BD45C4|nr:DUF2637 domain-containing protein [Streptomyces sp. CT34]
MNTTTETARPKVPPLTRPEKWLLGAVAVFAAGVGGLGLASSFEAVSAAGARWGFASPWMLPVGIDVAIPVFTAAFLLLIRTDMALGWVRFVPWVLTGVTCWLNIAAGHSLSAKVAHGTMPLLWVVLSEVAAHVYACRIGAVTGRRMEKIRRSRWLLAPLSTFALWRRMTLWEITSYTDALARERERQLARAQLRQRFGWRWRSKTPRPERVLLKLGALAPVSEDVPPASLQAPVPLEQEEPKQPRKRPGKSKGKPKGRSKPGKGQRTAAELLAEARTVTAGWSDDAINAEAIRTTLHCSAANSRVLRDLLLTERAEGRRLHPIDDDASEGDAGEGAAA